MSIREDSQRETIEPARRPAEPAIAVPAWKLSPPAARPGIVLRTGLVDGLLARDTTPVIAVLAPSGYGKTTLLAQWAQRRQPRVAWVSLNNDDNDPAVLLTDIAAAVDRIESIVPLDLRALAATGPIAAARQLLTVISALRQPISVVLDQFDEVTNRDCHDVVAALALGFPSGSQLAISSRESLPLPTARLRAQRGIVEIGIDELAMSIDEARSLLDGVGIEVSDSSVAQLSRKTEGWPAGLYLAALALTAGTRPDEVAATVTGDDRFMGDYLRSEFLDRVSEDDARFLTRTSVLDRLSGPLCDATLGATGSGAVLERLEHRNLLVVSLDRRRQWYRYHHLFRELLLSELRRREPETVTALHRRAAVWWEANGQLEIAIGHAQAADDPDHVARLVLQIANPVWASGRAETVVRWIEWFEANGLVERYPAIAVHGALMFALAGRPADTERWAAAALATVPSGMLADGNTMESSIAYLRTLLCRDGLVQMRDDARLALKGLSPASPYRATMLHAEGVSHLLEGDPDRADAFFARAAATATSAGVLPFIPVVLAERGIAAVGRDDWPAAEAFADEALASMQAGAFDDYWTSALVYAWAARVSLRRGEPGDAQRYLGHAARLRPLLTYALPVTSVQALLEMAHAYVAFADVGGARAVLRQANDIFQQRPALGVLPQQAADLRAKVDTILPSPFGVSSLTAAELRLLPFLATHLTFREIAERLYVSRHTTKSQSIAIYRKLGVTSRSLAITRLHELGLLAHV